MADTSDVETALVETALRTLYPLGLDKPCIVGGPVRVYRGSPTTGLLEADLTAGTANLSVFSMPDSTRITTRWAPVVYTTQGKATLSVQVSGNSITFSGTGGGDQVVGLLLDGQPFLYRGNAGDTPALIAAVLAKSVRSVRTCWLSGTTLTVPSCVKLVARVAADATTLTEWARQEQGFRVSAWCQDPLIRDHICSIVCSSFSSMSFLPLADGGAGRLSYRSTSSDDDNQNAHEYRRDLIYDVEYGTTQQGIAPVMLFGDLNLVGNLIYA